MSNRVAAHSTLAACIAGRDPTAHRYRAFIWVRRVLRGEECVWVSFVSLVSFVLNVLEHV
jgi:hypothetical protein